MRSQHHAERADEVALVEQARREVDRHVDVEAALAQLRRRAARLIHHEQAEPFAVLSLFGLAADFAGQDGAARRMRPARERPPPAKLERRPGRSRRYGYHKS